MRVEVIKVRGDAEPDSLELRSGREIIFYVLGLPFWASALDFDAFAMPHLSLRGERLWADLVALGGGVEGA
eukprot:scaffold434_cov186-Pinguiococcus_pyrenoidosus.AAC.44